MLKVLTKTAYYGLVGLVACLGILLLFTMMPNAPFQVKIVKSGSMEPAIRTGGIVVIKPEPVYKVGDVITFGADTKTQIPTTHRIVSIEGSGSTQKFVTKGDANDTEDPAVTSVSAVRGKVIFSLSRVGYVLDFARKPLGFIVLVGIPALVVIGDELRKIWKEIKKMRQKKLEERNNILDLRAKPKPMPNSDSNWKMLLSGMIVVGTVISLGTLKSTISFYNENETSSHNTFAASGDFGIPITQEEISPLTLSGESEGTTTPEVLGTSTEEIIPDETASSTAEVASSTPEIIPEPEVVETATTTEAVVEPEAEPAPEGEILDAASTENTEVAPVE